MRIRQKNGWDLYISILKHFGSQNLAENHVVDIQHSCYNTQPISTGAEIVKAAVLGPLPTEHKLDIKQLNTFKDQKGERRGPDVAFSSPSFHMNFMKVSNGAAMISGEPWTPRRVMNVVRLL